MKTHSILIVLCCSLLAGVTLRTEASGYSEAHRFVFYAVLEGCYEDGLSSNDVARILMRGPDNGAYIHFIYACPLCTPALHAFNAYRAQPPFYGMKNSTPTFGSGLDDELKKQLYSDKTEDRLIAINTLVQRWVKHRMAMLRLTDDERKTLVQSLEEMRKKGMQALKATASSPTNGAGDKTEPYGAKECAICNAAVGMALNFDK